MVNISKTAAKREELRSRIIALAEEMIAARGLAALRARELAEAAGCALGSLYNVFADLDDLILEVNGRTLAAIDETMSAATDPAPEQQLQKLAQSYLAFAKQHPLLWRALFEHHMPENRDLPAWYAEKLLNLMSRIASPLARLQSSLSVEELATRSRTLFAAVHGVVSISLDNRFVGIAQPDLAQELRRFIGVLLAGAEKAKA